ncbi:hypothetical protein [Granulicoccus phenolivorans]|uniref:hypothetical protein n=1 Tax=Granulicoccus phenolivorans TaxID=266854 RepID=UPI000413E8BE|nr:hypothetical protein [Granulicoccus phenolivorans]
MTWNAPSPGNMPPAPTPAGRALPVGVLVLIGVLLGALVVGGTIVIRPILAPAPTPSPTPVGSAAPPAYDACHPPAQGSSAPAEPDPTPAADDPVQTGTVRDGAPAVFTGHGNAVLEYTRAGDFATVVDFHCANCTGPLTVWNTNTATAILSGRTGGEVLDRRWLIDQDHGRPVPQRNRILVHAEGDWQITLTSWNDLPDAPSPVTGSGPAVLTFAGTPTDALRIGYRPTGTSDALHVYVYDRATRRYRAEYCTTGQTPLEISGLVYPAVILLRGYGEWRLEKA